MSKKSKPKVEQIQKEAILEMEGTVLDPLPNAMFRVQLDNSSGNPSEQKEILAHVSGKIRMHKIKIIPGDRVSIEMSPYDLSVGRITYRFKA